MSATVVEVQPNVSPSRRRSGAAVVRARAGCVSGGASTHRRGVRALSVGNRFARRRCRRGARRRRLSLRRRCGRPSIVPCGAGTSCSYDAGVLVRWRAGAVAGEGGGSSLRGLGSSVGAAGGRRSAGRGWSVLEENFDRGWESNVCSIKWMCGGDAVRHPTNRDSATRQVI